MSAVPLRILLVEDCEDDALILLRELRRGGYQPVHHRVETAPALRDALEGTDFDAAIIDYTMPGFDGIAALEILRSSGIDMPLIIFSGTIGEEIAVDAMRRGAHDYIMKSNMARLLPALERELREARMREERRRVLSMARHQANHDPVTQLPNRQLFQDRLRQAAWTASLHGASLSLALIDLDHFAAINEGIGHLQGDLVLAEIADRLRSAISRAGTVARLGNDEFAIIQPVTSIGAAIENVERALELIRRPISLADQEVSIDASVGVATFPDHGADAETLLQRAHLALRAAKVAQLDVRLFEPSLEHDLLPSMERVSQLRRALDHEPDQLFVVFQPKIRLATGQADGAEALVRWQHPTLGLLLPAEFIPLAESSGLIRRITTHVLNVTIAAAASLRGNGSAPRIAINLSTFDLEDPALPGQLTALLEQHGLPASAIEIEITEGAMMHAPLEAQKSLHALRDQGIGASVDDFGIGHSSLAYLKDLPLTAIKVDRWFVAEMATDPSSAAIVRSIIDLGHNLGFEVVAEGVEEPAALEMLVEMGCDLAQGLLLASPMPAADLSHWLSHQGANNHAGQVGPGGIEPPTERL